MDKMKMKLESADLLTERRAALRELFPEVFTEGKIDFEKLRVALGDQVETGRERYGLSWAGKAEAMRAVQIPSTATLVPDRGESVDWDATENVFIEGENLEVLKLLQKSYCGKVKMIYIDPPYNTGNEFIYPDNYRDSIGNYLRLTGQVSGEGQRLTTNTETGGRYHSNWLNMMYPRLFLARNLLTEDGVIFVSIDDHEVENLRCLMDEIFGEENFVASVAWQKKYAVASDDPGIGVMHDYVVVYQRSGTFERNLLPRTEKQTSRYVNLDNDPRGVWSSDNYVSNKSRLERPTLWYPIRHPKTGEEVWPDESAVWRYSREKHKVIAGENRLYWGPNLSYKRPRLKRFLSEVQDGVVPSTWWPFDEVGHNDEAQKETAELIGPKVFSTPKPVRLIRRMVQLSSAKSDLVLDFFAGSGTTGQAVLEQNLGDGGNRRFILVQIPTPTESTQFRTIAGVARARLHKVFERASAVGNRSLDFGGGNNSLGARAFRLTTSNFKTWNADYLLTDESALADQLRLHTDHVLPDRGQEDILFEILLKAGYPLTSRIVEIATGDQKVFSISGGNLVICLEAPIYQETLRAIMALQPRPVQVICLDHAFEGNDQVKTNLKLEMQAQEIQFRTV